MSRVRRSWWAVVAVVVVALLVPVPARAAGSPVSPYSGLNPLTSSQQASLLAIARDTWKFYGADVDQATSLPMDNITFAGGSATPTGFGSYTSAALDNALRDRALQRDFARDPVSWAAHTYLSMETMSL